MKSHFLEFLEARGLLSSQQAHEIRAQSAQFRESLAAVALRHGLLAPDHLDALLEAGGGRDLIEVAVERGFLTAEHAERLATLKTLQELLEMAEGVVLKGWLGAHELWRQLTAFFAELAEEREAGTTQATGF